VAELEIGRRLRGQSYLGLHFADLRTLDLKQFGADLLLGSAVIGPILAILLGGFVLWASRRRQMHPEIAALREETARPYMDAGITHWEFVRGKLRYDPVYFSLLRQGLLPPAGSLLDLGCGRGIVFSLLLAARKLHGQGTYPQEWPPPPRLVFRGIEGRPRAAEVARQALAGEAEIATADLRTSELPQADAILLLDVLHYLPAADQEPFLARVAAALAPGGVLLIRDADAGGGWRFTATRIQERLSALLRGHFRQRYHYRSAAEWRAILEGLGLTVDLHPMAMGTPYANVLLAARRS
jgi:SAM-dependent methyltransferase